MEPDSASQLPHVSSSIGSGVRPHRHVLPAQRYLLSLNVGNDKNIPSKREQTAIHEAAHVVVATMIRRGIVQEVFISDVAVDVQNVSMYDELNLTIHGITGGVRFHEMQTTLFENGLIAYSGFFAECENLFRCGVNLEPLLPQLRSQAAHDIDRFQELLVLEGLPESEIHSIVVNIGGTLKHYFDNGLWEAARVIADALLVRGYLNGEDVLELLPDFP